MSLGASLGIHESVVRLFLLSPWSQTRTTTTPAMMNPAAIKALDIGGRESPVTAANPPFALATPNPIRVAEMIMTTNALRTHHLFRLHTSYPHRAHLQSSTPSLVLSRSRRPKLAAALSERKEDCVEGLEEVATR